jgi:gliding motility-associated-like protein
MWPYVNSTVTCNGILGNSLAPIACNWNGLCNGNTGMAPLGQLPLGGDQTSYEIPLNVTAGQQYLLCLSNYSGTSQNVNLNFFGSASVACGVSAPDQTICLGTSANVTIASPGVTSPQFNWLVTTGVSNTAGGTNVLVTPTMTTTYSVEVYQPASATSSVFQDTAIFTINVESPPVPNAGIDDTVCLGSAIYLQGNISSTSNSYGWQCLAAGITPSPTVNFNPPTSSLNPTVTVNQPGLYSFILTENNSVCGSVKDTVRVLVISINQVLTAVSPSCFGYADGSISVTSQSAVEYSFDNGITWQTSSTQNGLIAGTYTVCSRSAQGCQTCSSTVVNDPPQVTITTSNDTTICQNGTALLEVSATGGNIFEFNWDFTTDVSSTQLVNPTSTSTYSVFAENQNGCMSATQSIVVTLYDPISGILTPPSSICPGYPVDLIAGASGGSGGPYSFSWNTGELAIGLSDTIIVNPPQTSNYTVSIEDGCESTPILHTTSVTLLPLPIPLIAIDFSNRCEPAVFSLSNQTDATMVEQLEWNISNGDTFYDMESVQTSEMNAGTYDVQLIVTSPQGCTDSTTFSQYITVHPKPVADFVHSPNPAYLYEPKIHFYDNSINGSSYQWFFEAGQPENSLAINPVSTFPEGQVGEYDVMLIASSEFGCLDTTIESVIVIQDVVLFVPNTFTPDANEFNQSWQITIDGIDRFSFQVYVFNRWGEIIWESRNPDIAWDGTYDGKLVHSGTYTWLIKAKDKVNDNQYTWNGFVNVIH